jgi:hypothetical protein
MSNDVKLDERFLEPVESMGLALETAQVPLIIASANDLVAFVEQVASLLGGTVVYTSQPDFVEQMLASMRGFDYLFAVIDRPLAQTPKKMIRAYLDARDLISPNRSALADGFGAEAPDPKHRLILLIDRAVFDRHDDDEKRALAERCTVIGLW